MRVSYRSKKLVDQAFIDGRGWVDIRPAIPLRRLWWKKNRHRSATAVRLVGLGDYKVSELQRRRGGHNAS